VNSEAAAFLETSDDEFERVMNVNLRGVWNCMKSELRQMMAQGSGAIVNCSSIGGLKGSRGRSAYSASKHAVIGLTRSAALDYAATGVRINAVCPGMVKTPMAVFVTKNYDPEIVRRMVAQEPIGRFGEPEEIAAAVVWLCSPAANYASRESLSNTVVFEKACRNEKGRGKSGLNLSQNSFLISASQKVRVWLSFEGAMTIKPTKTRHSTARAKRRLRPAAPKVARARTSDAGEITSKPMLLGYARVSTVDQNLALQRNALTEAGCTKIFTEQMSGAVTDRPALHDALEFARSGDTLIVWKLDRLARSMKQLIETVETLRLRGIGFRSLTEALDTTTAQGRLVFHMFGALAEFERSLIRERTQAGLAAARRAGRTGGRPPKLTDDDIEAAKAMLANPDIGVTQIAHRLGVSPATLYRYIPAARTANTPGV